MNDILLKDKVRHIEWRGDRLRILDQRLLPRTVKYLDCRSAPDVAKATRDMALRGAPLIGCAAAYGMALAARKGDKRALVEAAMLLKKARPTAVNLAHAVDYMLGVARSLTSDLARGMAKAAQDYYETDLKANYAMARLGAGLLKKDAHVITYCNAGALATSGLGTSLGVIRWAHKNGRVAHVYACETRPFLQGSRLTVWELMQAGVPCTLITDNMAAHLMKTHQVDAVITGADRIAASGDVCNKIGTYMLAILAKFHGVPYYAVAPTSTVDLATPTGDDIPIEERSAREVVELSGVPLAPEGAKARHFAFDVTPAKLVSAIVTEKGVVRPVTPQNLRRVVRG